MAEAQVALDTNNDRSNHYSRPVFKQVLKVNSLQAQRVMERSFERVSNSLFSIDVILRIIGEQEEIDQVETVILEHISKVSEDLDKATAQLNKLMEDNGELIAMDKYADKLSKIIKAKRDMQDVIKQNDNLTVAEKRMKLKAMEIEEQKLYDKYLDIYKQKTQQRKDRLDKASHITFST